MTDSNKQNLWLRYGIIIVASLGYFVDIYDLILFNVVKKESMIAMLPFASAEEIKNTGLYLFNMQMIGMLVGGLLWGILGDKRGRLSVLFGSILLYSIANIANAFVTTIPMYALVRLVAGIGLAGELGTGITLVTETMHREKRGYGTMIIVSFGALGAVLAAVVGMWGDSLGVFFTTLFHQPIAKWQAAYIVGGILGLLLLLLRIGTVESGMFKSVLQTQTKRGDFLHLFRSKERMLKYFKCILIGLPIWFIVGIIVANAELIWGKELGVAGVQNGLAVMFSYIGLSVGDLLSGILSQVFRSRKKVVMGYIGFCIIVVTYFFFFAHGISLNTFYFLCFLLGAATGFWALFVTIAAEQFGTNIRSTVTNTTPNFVRGSVPLITWSFQSLVALSFGNILSAFIVGMVCMGLSFWATYHSQETFSKDLDYTE
ncbi:MAG: MFS transporter [Bacteroidetes bacterium]|nr:MFS transporter [Bacteroidota bacterium]